MMSGIMFLVFIVLLIIGVPIAWALGLASLVIVLVDPSIPMELVIMRMFNATSNFALLAAPFFILSGSIMSEGGLSKRLVDFFYSLVKRVRGGLAVVTTLACAFFSALTGSSPATSAAVGTIMIPEMRKKGYDDEFSSAVVAASGATGCVIPPSTPLVLFGSMCGVSVGDLLLGGVTPGLLMSAAMIVCILIMARRLGYKKSEEKLSLKEILKTFISSFAAILMPVIVLGGIYGGIFTPTESAVVSSVYGIIVCMVIYRAVRPKDLPKIFVNAAKQTGTALVILNCASLFSYILTVDQIPQLLAKTFLNVTDNPLICMLLINILFLIVGTFLSTNAAVIILGPILLPVAKSFGIDPVAFGVIMVANLAIGCITPPVGTNLFVTQTISGVRLERIFVNVIPLFISLLIALALMNIFPQMITLLPNLMKG
ncbi:MAG: TRAP transporter large permease [Oscillospiraceae bacterium]